MLEVGFSLPTGEGRGRRQREIPLGIKEGETQHGRVAKKKFCPVLDAAGKKGCRN